ncbi:MAG: beta-glucosidase [Paracrocinitomix sp.]
MAPSPTPEHIANLTLESKAAITAGYDIWTVPGIESLGIPPLRMTDGPNGARGAKNTLGSGDVRAVCVPTGTALAASFDEELLGRIGDLLGRETRQKRARVLLAPTINLIRSPLYGRTFETYGEDPWLSGKLAAAFVSGVQAQGVATTPKHLIGNEAEYQRTTINSVIDERTLREVYLLPFEFAIRHGNALGVMTSYNRVNGTYCSEDSTLLNGILRDEWGFEGFVVSDWFAAGTTVGALEGGLDVQMPGPDRFFGAPVAKAITNGEVDEAHLDAIVDRRIHVHRVLDAWDNDVDEPERSVEHLPDRQLAHEAAVAAMVLLENDGMLPVDPSVSSIAVIGPNAVTAHIMGGGSSQLPAHRRIPPADMFRERFGDRVTVEQGCIIDKNAPPVRPDAGFDVDIHLSNNWSGPAAVQLQQKSGRTFYFGAPHAAVGTESFTARMTGTVTPTITGEHTFSLIQVGPARVIIDGQVIIDGIDATPARGEAFFGLGSVEMQATVALTAGTPVEVVIEFVGGAGNGIKGLIVGHKPPPPTDLIERAVAAAGAAEVAIVIVGTSNEWETEGNDRASMDLPGDQVELIRAVSAANPQTCVVVNAGSPVDLSWTDQPAATVFGWLGGQEMASALVDVLFGDAEPGGRLPVTMPLTIEHTPSYGTFPGESNNSIYTEGTLVGYRWYDTRKLAVQYPFGYGQSYTTFEWSEPSITSTGPASCRVGLTVTNTGDRAGSDVVQLYVSPPPSKFTRPKNQLAGVAKVHLGAGESQQVTIDLSPRSFALWDPANQDHVEAHKRLAGSGAGVGLSGGSSDATEAGWYVEAGDYELNLARSVADVVACETFTMRDPLGPLTNEQSLP